MNKLQAYQATHSRLEIHKACQVLIDAISEDEVRNDLVSPWSNEELRTMRELMAVRTRNKSLDYEAAMKNALRVRKT